MSRSAPQPATMKTPRGGTRWSQCWRQESRETRVRKMVMMMRRIVLIIMATCDSVVVCYGSVEDVVVWRDYWGCLGIEWRARNAKLETVRYRKYYVSRLEKLKLCM